MCILSGYWLSLLLNTTYASPLNYGSIEVFDQKVKRLVLKKVENKETGKILATLLIANMFFPEVTSKSQGRKILPDNK